MKKTIKVVIFSFTPYSYPNILTRTRDETFQESETQHLSKHIFERQANNKYDNSGSQFLRATT